MQSGKEIDQAAGDESILPNGEEGNAEGGAPSESCAVESPLGESHGELSVEAYRGAAKGEAHRETAKEAANERAVTPPRNNAASREGSTNSDAPKEGDTHKWAVQEKGERQPSVESSEGEGEVIPAGDKAAGNKAVGENGKEDPPLSGPHLSDAPLSDAPLSDAPLSDASFSEAFFDQASQFQKAPEDPKGKSQSHLADLYKEMKKREHLFLSHFDHTGDDSKPTEVANSWEEERKEKKGKGSIPQIDFTSMEAISQFLLHEDTSDNEEPPIERQLREHIQQFTQEQKKNNKKIKMNRYYLSVGSYQNTLPPSLRQSIFKEYRKNF
ncbi:hypothetical protein, conserved [Plasmodium vivax]|uniref:Uncharacterized protein n=1 Tax=Plasmodium vivax (strain Salvador I) TaxID=126793 RepID=A5KBE0_PLAVS|nr:hypothetical protein, conserved [Plasmodium vivax]EDL43418.1 hypothetical protein, conserved [Plasmodium vivax]|eukprot:XP_001613145.1 hypothetical protein [Plasmodium vivax Sal-1]